MSSKPITIKPTKALRSQLEAWAAEQRLSVEDYVLSALGGHVHDRKEMQKKFDAAYRSIDAQRSDG